MTSLTYKSHFHGRSLPSTVDASGAHSWSIFTEMSSKNRQQLVSFPNKTYSSSSVPSLITSTQTPGSVSLEIPNHPKPFFPSSFFFFLIFGPSLLAQSYSYPYSCTSPSLNYRTPIQFSIASSELSIWKSHLPLSMPPHHRGYKSP